MLRTEALVVGYAGTAVLGPLDLYLESGEVVCLLGANGAGKSTLIRSLAGMQPALSGRVWLDGEVLSALSSRVRAQQLAVVLTDRVHGGLMTGYDLVCLGRYPHVDWGGRLGARDYEAVELALHQVGAEALAARQVIELSDGERQKIMVARALAQEPRLLILDEVTAFLDLPRRVEVMQILHRLARTRGIAVLLSTHDLDLAQRIADRVWLVDERRELQIGAPEDLMLHGHFARAFASEGLRFDADSGELLLRERDSRPVQLTGEGPRRLWAERALKRAGYHVAEAAPLRVVANEDSFVLHNGAAVHHHRTLAALVSALPKASA